MSVFFALLALVFAIVALVRIGKLRERIETLSNQVSILDRQLDRALKSAAVFPQTEKPDPAQKSPEPAAPPAPPIDAPPPEAASRPVPSVALPSQPAVPHGAPPPIAPRPTAPATPVATPTPSAPAPAAVRRAESWETVIGGSWLSRIGIAMLVIGIAFALGYTLTQVGPLGKSMLAVATSLALICAGVLMERREAYRFYARGLIGGGWAILYATAYAVHELEATRIVESPVVGFLILLAVGAGMILHSLRYANQGLTTLAYGLAYAAIVLHSISAYTLAAATLLGLGTMAHLTRRRWYGAALGGIVATYGSLFLWFLRQEPPTMQTLRLGLTALAIDWIVFLAPDFVTRARDDIERNMSRVVSLLNALVAAGMALHATTRFLPGKAWVAPAIFGTLYAVTSVALHRMDRRAVQQMHSIACVLFIAVAAGKALPVLGATAVWLLEAQVVVLIGIGVRDVFHRWLGSILFLLPASAVLIEQVRLRALLPDGALDLRRLALNAAACACFYFTQARLRAAAAQAGTAMKEHEITLRMVFSHAAFAIIALSIWVQLPMVWVAPALSGLMLLLFEISTRWKDVDLRYQAWIATVASAAVVLPFCIPSTAMTGPLRARSVALVAVALSFLVVFFRLAAARACLLVNDEMVRPLFSWGATVLLAIAVWLDARTTMVGPLWMIGALLLIEAGLGLGEIHLRRPGYLLLLSANASLLLSNLTATSEGPWLGIRTMTVVPGIAATYYLWWRLRALPGSPGSLSDAWDERIGRALSYAGAAMVGLYVRFQFGLEGAAMRWALAMVALFIVADRLRDADFRIQAYAIGVASLVRAIGFDFQHASPVLGMDGPLIITTICTVSYVVAALHLRSRAAAPRPDRRTLALEQRLSRYGDDLMWVLALALPALYAYRTRTGTLLVVLWTLEGLIAAGAGFALRTRSLRIGGMVLLGLSLVVTLVRAFTTFDMMGRIITFLLLGIVLLLVSFGYTRYRQRARSAP